jgi:SAM-dependent methyltransferase
MERSGDAEAESIDAINQSIWIRDAARFEIEGWSDPGELAALTFVADLVRDLPTLDIGVGGGRTYSLLRLLTRDYVAIDYTEELVRRCRVRHPEADVRLADARDLSQFSDESFGFALFSSNGIDAVDHAGRQEVIDNVGRVLRPDGIFVFSTLNKDGELYGASPANAPAETWLPGSLLPRGLQDETASEHHDADWGRAVRNWRKLKGLQTDNGDHGMAPFAAHEFSLVTHFVTLPGARSEMDRHGFDLLAVFPCDSFDNIAHEETTAAMYFYLVARLRHR